ncbi:DUF6415 family natural product biosynthesis protein [Streptomyces sp. MS1.AVA.3]|uniref:DUF6415 family natural product biosynthesis protein n=1 Tax=Streptomyces decoyicus TaxID=249567 RepID=UPI0030C153A3
MDTERAQLTAAEDAPPIDVVTIEATIAQAVRAGTRPAVTGDLVDLHTLLCGHIALLIPSVRAAAELLWHGGHEWHRQTARLDGIERQVAHGLGDSDFSRIVQVQLLARDCRWLLDECTTRVTR